MQDNDLYLMLGGMQQDLKTLIKGQQEVKLWQHEHEAHDKTNFAALSQEVANMNKYGKAIAIVSGFIGGVIGFVFKSKGGA